MRKAVLFIALLLAFKGIAQIPPGYYNTASGLSGEPLRLALSNIIRPHVQLTYTPGLWNAYRTTDTKPSGKIWDMYSDVPGGTPPYEFTYSTDQCGSVTPTTEGVCYNREHLWPRSKFNDDTPMLSDLFHVIPTDYLVNGDRSDNPHAKVGTATKTFRNGAKLGNNVYPGAPSGTCYEPLDSFKGDIARTYFYVTTCYMKDSNLFFNWEMATNVRLKQWAIQMLLDWHHMDPVSRKEIDRNNAAYALQRNRNPFIDHPEYADCIWGTGPCPLGIDDVSAATSKEFVWYSTAEHIIHITEPFKTHLDGLMVTDATGRIITRTNGDVDASFYAPGMYIVTAAIDGQRYAQRVVVW